MIGGGTANRTAAGLRGCRAKRHAREHRPPPLQRPETRADRSPYVHSPSSRTMLHGEAQSASRRHAVRPDQLARRRRPGLGARETVALLAGLMALNAFAIDAMIPALPAIGDDLGVARENDRQLVVDRLHDRLRLDPADLGAARRPLRPQADPGHRRGALRGVRLAVRDSPAASSCWSPRGSPRAPRRRSPGCWWWRWSATCSRARRWRG